MTEFHGRTVLITGAAGGIGSALAEGFAARGARLALVDRVDCTELLHRLPGEHRAWRLDLTDPEAIGRIVGEIGQAMGIDILINNAGLGLHSRYKRSVPDTAELPLSPRIRPRLWLLPGYWS